MDSRYGQYQRLAAETISAITVADEQQKNEIKRTAQVMEEGIAGEFWLHLKAKIDQLVLDTEKRFVDSLAPTYEDWSRRQALITIISATGPTLPRRSSDVT
mgnify:CR=1 FL=1